MALLLGTAPNQVPTNADLGTMAFQDEAAVQILGGAINNVVIGATTPVAATVTNLAYTGTLTGGTGVVNLGSGQFVKDSSGNLTLVGKVSAVSYTETVFAIIGTTPALTPNNGSIQTWTLSASSTPTAGTWASGQSLTLMIDDGTAFTVTWTSMPVTWVGGSAPTLALTGYNVVELWKVGTVIYGAFVGST